MFKVIPIHRENRPVLHKKIIGSEGDPVNQLRNFVLSTKFDRITLQRVFASFIALLLPIILPIVHMLIFKELWGNLKTPVDRKQCKCSCWDTVFKGPYENGVANYKHVYFNSNTNTLKMWIITVMGVLGIYEAFKRFFFLLLHKRLRWTMAVLFLSSLHSHYYGWWGFWNFWNDDFYPMWYHQIFFSLTELISSVLVVKYLDSRRRIEPIPMLIIGNIAIFHIFCSGWDQFVFNVLGGHGKLHQILRDVAFMMTDFMYVAVSFNQIRSYAGKKGMPLLSLLAQRRHIVIVLNMNILMYLYVLLFP